MKKYNKRYRTNNPEENRKSSIKWNKNNPEKRKEITKRYRKSHREERLEYQRQFNKNNPEYKKQWQSHKLKTDLKYNLNRRISGGIYKSLKGNKMGRGWENLIGYTLNDLIKHLKKTIPKGFSWQDLLEGKLHIDHKIPKSAFNYAEPEHIDFKRCWALKNLQLLPAKKNRIKYNKLTRPFQPALTM